MKKIMNGGVNMGLPNPTLSFRIPVELLKALEEMAKKEDCTKTKILIEALNQYLKIETLDQCLKK